MIHARFGCKRGFQPLASAPNGGGGVELNSVNVLRSCLVALLLSVAGCASKPAAPPHYASLEDYFAAEHRDLTGFWRRDDPDKLMKCYAESAMRDIPPEVQPALLTAANKSVSGQTLTAAEMDLKATWLDDRPRLEGDILHVPTPRSLGIVRGMAITCIDLRLSK